MEQYFDKSGDLLVPCLMNQSHLSRTEAKLYALCWMIACHLSQKHLFDGAVPREPSAPSGGRKAEGEVQELNLTDSGQARRHSLPKEVSYIKTFCSEHLVVVGQNNYFPLEELCTCLEVFIHGHQACVARCPLPDVRGHLACPQEVLCA